MRKIMKKRYFLAFLFMAICLTASASCGTTDYSGSSGKLYDMVVYVVAMCSLTVQLLYAIAAVLSMVAAINGVPVETGLCCFSKERSFILKFLESA